MKAVNLIPAEERRAVRGQGAGPSLATRLLLGGLGMAVLAVTVLVLVSNQINSKRDELGKLHGKQENAVAATEALRPYGEFVAVQEARYSTVTGIASSRFNWERVVRQLSRVVPPKVWIMEFKGTVSKDTSSGGSGGGGSGGGGGSNLRGSIAGPAVELKGCAPTQSDTALLMTRLRNIDGVESVVMTKSSTADAQTGAGAAAPTPSSPTAGAAAASASCPKLEFEIVIAIRAGGGLAAAAAATPEAAAQAAAAGTTGATGATGTTGAVGTTTAGATK